MDTMRFFSFQAWWPLSVLFCKEALRILEPDDFPPTEWLPGGGFSLWEDTRIRPGTHGMHDAEGWPVGESPF